MNNFLEFINKDIDAKRLLISSMPIKTKPNQKKLNKTISEYEEKYTEYKNSVKTYLLAKNHSLEVKTKNHKDEKSTKEDGETKASEAEAAAEEASEPPFRRSCRIREWC